VQFLPPTHHSIHVRANDHDGTTAFPVHLTHDVIQTGIDKLYPFHEIGLMWCLTATSFLAFVFVSVEAFVPIASSSVRQTRRPGASGDVEEVDVVVVGAGIGGLSCAALTAKYGFKTLCVEAHDTPGGVAHSFSRYSSASKSIPFRFDSGPSLITGLSSKSTNPLRQVLDAIGTADEIDWKQYDGWLVHDFADGKAFKLTAGNSGAFEQALEDKAGAESRKAFEKFRRTCRSQCLHSAVCAARWWLGGSCQHIWVYSQAYEHRDARTVVDGTIHECHEKVQYE
jgi:hypothetical protein